MKSIVFLFIFFLLIGGITYGLFYSASSSNEKCSNTKFTTQTGCEESGATWGAPKEKNNPSTPATTAVVRDTKPSVPAGCIDKSGVWHCTTPVDIDITTPLTFEPDGLIDISYGDVVVHTGPGQTPNWPTPQKTDSTRSFRKPATAKNEVTFRIYP